MAVEVPTPTGPARPDLKILETRIYRGPNIWSYQQAIHLVVDLGSLEEYPTVSLAGFTDQLVELVPGLERHTCSLGRRGGFIERLREGTWLGHVAEHVALQLQTLAGHDSRRGKTRAVKGKPGHYNVVYSYTDETVGVAAGKLAVRLINHLVEPEDGFDFDTEFNAFLRQAERVAFGPSTAAILEEAASRDIPYIRLNSASLVQLGQGVHAQRIRATMTSKTGALAVDIASDKDLTTKLLGSAGLPVPKQEAVRTMRGTVEAARRIGFPVVVKPLDGNHGRGVCLNLQSDDGGREGVRHRQGRVAARHDHRRVVRHGPRLPLPHRRRPDAGDRRARARPRRRGRHAHGRRARRDHERRPPPRCGSREGPDEDQGRRQRARDPRRSGTHARVGAARGRDGQARAHGQHVDGWHLHRPHVRRAPRQRRDRRGGRPHGRARRRGHRLHLPRHHLPRPRDGRGDLRGQRRSRLPHAHAPDGR